VAAAAGARQGGGPSGAAIIRVDDGVLEVPDTPVVPFIMGDGSGADLWHTTREVLDEAVQRAYSGTKAISWLEVVAGMKAIQRGQSWLPEDTVEAFRAYRIGMKGALHTPKGGGSVTVALRQALDLYCNVRPVWYVKGVASPMRRPELVNVTLFREATEDTYTDLELAAATPAARDLRTFLGAHGMDVRPFPTDSTAFAVKTISREGTERLMEAALQFSLAHDKRNLVIVHKGTVMKATEGYFRDVAYEVATQRYRDHCVTERESLILGNYERGLVDPEDNAQELEPGLAFMTQEHRGLILGEVAAVLDTIGASHGDGKWKTKLLVKDGLVSSVLQQVMLRPSEFDVLVAPNLYGVVLGSWLLGQIGGAGVCPSGSYNFQTGHAVFEATAGPGSRSGSREAVHPCGPLLAGSMMLQQLGWTEAAAMVARAVQQAVVDRATPLDVRRPSRALDPAALIADFGRAVADNLLVPPPPPPPA